MPMKIKKFRLYRLPIWGQAIVITATIACMIGIMQAIRIMMWIAYGISKGIL